MPFHALKEFIVSPVRLLSNNIYKYSIYRIKMQSLNLKICTRIVYRDVIILTSKATLVAFVYIFITIALGKNCNIGYIISKHIL